MLRGGGLSDGVVQAPLSQGVYGGPADVGARLDGEGGRLYQRVPPACLIYLADIINQYGSAPSLVKSGINNLDELHKYALSNGYGAYEKRRTNTYNAIKKAESDGKLTPEQLAGMSGDTGKGTLGWPVPGVSYISSKFGYRNISISKGMHPGIDIADRGANVKIVASHNGTLRHNTTGSWGRWIR